MIDMVDILEIKFILLEINYWLNARFLNMKESKEYYLFL